MLEQRLIENLIKSLKKEVYKDLKKYRKQGDDEAESYCRGYIQSLNSLTKELHFYFDKAFSEHKIDETIELNSSGWMN